MYGAMVVFSIGTLVGIANTEPLPPQYDIQRMGTFPTEEACQNFLFTNYTPISPNLLKRDKSKQLVYEEIRRSDGAQVGPVGTFCAPVDFNE